MFRRERMIPYAIGTSSRELAAMRSEDYHGISLAKAKDIRLVGTVYLSMKFSSGT